MLGLSLPRIGASWCRFISTSVSLVESDSSADDCSIVNLVSSAQVLLSS